MGASEKHDAAYHGPVHPHPEGPDGHRPPGPGKAIVIAVIVAVAVIAAALIGVAVATTRAHGATVDDCASRAEARSAYVGTPFRPWLNAAIPDPAWGVVRWQSDRVRDVQACRWRTDVLRVRLLDSGPQIRSWRWLRCDGADCATIERYPTP